MTSVVVLLVPAILSLVKQGCFKVLPVDPLPEEHPGSQEAILGLWAGADVQVVVLGQLQNGNRGDCYCVVVVVTDAIVAVVIFLLLLSYLLLDDDEEIDITVLFALLLLLLQYYYSFSSCFCFVMMLLILLCSFWNSVTRPNGIYSHILRHFSIMDSKDKTLSQVIPLQLLILSILLCTVSLCLA